MISLLLGFLGLASALQLLPPIQWTQASEGGYCALEAPKVIWISSEFQATRDGNGMTLIPPSAYEFAEVFRQDLEQLYGCAWKLEQASALSKDTKGIVLGRYRGSARDLTYENGAPTEEGYELEVSDGRVYIGGSGARGMFWGTRTLLQLLGSDKGDRIAAGHVVDAPAYPTRGFLIDAGRKWYEPEFLKELCAYASFFKMSEFHYHSSDNYPLTRGHNETWQDVYSQFSLRPDSPDLQNIVQRYNETLSRKDFEDLQTHCASRGVTIIPEIEAPGHALSITKWKPELALAPQDLLNLSHPDTIPTVKAIWSEFLPWFQTKEVHIGADEYDATLADDYIAFVNEMSDFINSTSGKRIRIWGTLEPSNKSTISTDVIVQHWQYGQSDPVQLNANGYDLVNSEDWWAYVTLKNDHTPVLPAPYPQFFNITRILNFANQPGWQWLPALFNYSDVTAQLRNTSKHNKGAIICAWNDNGPDPTTELEAYYAIQNGIPIVAARAWTGARGPKLDPSKLQSTFNALRTQAPTQNLDRRLPTERRGKRSGALFSWAKPSSALARTVLGQGSKGMNYTLNLSVTGPFTLWSDDDSLSLTPEGNLTFISDGWRYPLRSVGEHDGFDPPNLGRIWTNVTSSTHEPVNVPMKCSLTIKTDPTGGSRVWVDAKLAGRFEALVFGGHNTLTSWSQMAFVAPLETVEGGIDKIEVLGTI